MSIPGVYKYQHGVHGNIFLKIIGNECSFFSIEKNSKYGTPFTFSNKNNLISRIKGNFHYQKDDFTLNKAIKYVTIGAPPDTKKSKLEEFDVESDEPLINIKKETQGIPESQVTKEMQENEVKKGKTIYKYMKNGIPMVIFETNDERRERENQELKDIQKNINEMKLMTNTKEETYLESLQMENVSEISDYLTFEDMRLLMQVSKQLFNIVFMANRHRININYSFFKHGELLIRKSDVRNLVFDFTVDKEDHDYFREAVAIDIKNFSDLALVKLNNSTLKLIHKSLDGTGIKTLEVIFDEPSFDMSHLPRTTQTLKIIKDAEFNGPIIFNKNGKKPMDLATFICPVEIDGEFPNLNGVREVKINKVVNDFTLPNTVVRATFFTDCKGPLSLPNALVKLQIGNKYRNSIIPLPRTLDKLYINMGNQIDNSDVGIRSVFGTTDIEGIYNLLPKSLVSFFFVTNGVLVGKVKTLPPNIRVLGHRTTTGSFDFRDIKYPSSLRILSVSLHQNRGTITNWPDNIVHLSLTGKESNSFLIKNLPKSLKTIEFIDFDTKIEFPPKVEEFVGTTSILIASRVPDSLKHLTVNHLVKLTNAPVVMSKNLEVLEYFDADKLVELPDTLKKLFLRYPDNDRFGITSDIFIKDLPRDLETFNLNPGSRNYKIHYTDSNNKNIRNMEFINTFDVPRFVRPEDNVLPANSGRFLTIPHSLQHLHIVNVSGTFYGINFLTNDHPHLSRIHVDKKTIFIDGNLLIPKDYGKPLVNLRDDIESIIFEEGSQYDVEFKPPKGLKYIRVPKGSTHLYFNWNRNDIKYETNSE